MGFEFMKRRDLIKTGLLGLGASAVALSGCDKKENISSEFNIVPKQTDTYKFSAPLLFSFKAIDEFAKCNEKFKKSKITTLYNSIPWPQSENFNEWFMLMRGGRNPEIKTYKDFGKYAKYAMDRGFEVVYLMNSPKAFNDRDIEPFKKDFYKLLDNLWNSGIKKIKFANTQVAQLINEYNPEFKLSIATILEYSSISQYRALFELFPNIYHICVPKDLNQNFRFLASLRKAFPKVEIEMMCNEGCFKWCPTRFSCMASSYSTYYKLGCNFVKQNKLLQRVYSGIISPWHLEYYSALGINNFKLLCMGDRASSAETLNIVNYLKIAEYGLENEENRKNIKDIYKTNDLEGFMANLPKMEYFVHHGHECTYKCKTECNYCFECAEKLKKYYKPKSEKV